MEENELSGVYILPDAEGRVLRCEGGYTISSIDDSGRWVLVDEGDGDRYNLCQTHYFTPGLRTADGICRYVYENGIVRLRGEDEIENDRRAAPQPDYDPEDAVEALKILLGEEV